MTAANTAPSITEASLRLSTILRVVQGAVVKRRRRLPAVGPRLSEEGVPPLWGWASCLTLGDLEAALSKAVA